MKLIKKIITMVLTSGIFILFCSIIGCVDFYFMWRNLMEKDYLQVVIFFILGVVMCYFISVHFQGIKNIFKLFKLEFEVQEVKQEQKPEEKPIEKLEQTQEVSIIDIKFTNNVKIVEPLGFPIITSMIREEGITKGSNSIMSTSIPKDWVGKEAEVEIKIKLKQ